MDTAVWYVWFDDFYQWKPLLLFLLQHRTSYPLAKFIVPAHKYFPFTYLKMWKATSGVGIPDFVDTKVTKYQWMKKRNFFVFWWRICHNGLIQIQRHDIQCLLRGSDQTWHTIFFSWQFRNGWKFEDAASWFKIWPDDSSSQTQRQNWLVDAGNHRSNLTILKRRCCDGKLWRILDWIIVDEDDFTVTTNRSCMYITLVGM